MPYTDLAKRKTYHREYMREYNKTHSLTSEQKAKKLAYMKIYAEKNADRISEYLNQRYVVNKKVISAKKSVYKKSPQGRLMSYKQSAKERGLDFSLSTEDFNLLLTSDCHYCGKERANGVDRMNNDIGYYSYNVVPCCKVCNFMKRDLHHDEFIEHTLKILDNLA